MIHYLLLLFCSFLIIYLSKKVWDKTRELAFILGIALIYYWSLAGAWFIIFDNLTGNMGKELGLHYYHFTERLFPLKADHHYMQSIFLYALFIICIQITILLFSKKKNRENLPAVFALELNHKILIVLCLGASAISLMLVFEQILIAAKFHQSVYIITRHHPGKTFTIHQLLNQISVLALFIGLITFVADKTNASFKRREFNGTFLFYLFAVLLVESYLLFLGNKREILFGGILGGIYYCHLVRKKINYVWLSIFAIIIVLPMYLSDGLRGYSPFFLTKYFDTSSLEYHPVMEIVYSEFSVKGAALTFLFSNEMFCGHFSLYGVLSHDLPFTYGSSLVSLIASLVPGFLWPGRPGTIYNYYIEQVHAMPGQGYTIHHATGWYLNFGIAGVVVGAFILGWIWTYLYNCHQSIHLIKNNFFRILYTVGIAAFTAQLPSLIRSGPEGYKSMFFEALVLPAVIVYFSGIFNRKIKND